ncbi:ATP synthase F1 subunit epsilon [Roseburia sp. 499]|uniref:ATP synthase F1 subunit epsilon n=1 Tax=Roseburia sp. 499 TaxID=1261634 RepID=UPI0009534727|nr:ATP synthase F1 subunit epsilon [Roseburia sp. 499]WVK69674.1 ATP synthase F1 subunit epsilon [Roseburia sp. 499]
MAEENKFFRLEIITPDRKFYEGEASMVEFTSTEGEMGVYKHHIPLTAVLAPGIVTITEAEGKKEAAIHAGFVEILPDKVTFLAEIAEWPEEIDVARAEASRSRAEERLHNHAAEIDVARAEIALKKALVRIDIKR